MITANQDSFFFSHSEQCKQYFVFVSLWVDFVNKLQVDGVNADGLRWKIKCLVWSDDDRLCCRECMNCSCGYELYCRMWNNKKGWDCLRLCFNCISGLRFLKSKHVEIICCKFICVIIINLCNLKGIDKRFKD